MSMQSRPWPVVPEQTAAAARAAFPKGALAMRVRDELPGLFADEEFAAAFGVRGRPGISPGQLALVTVLQFAENLPDRQAAHAVAARIDWKYALGLELTDPGFDFSVLSKFRARLVEHGLEEKVLELLLARCAERGLVKAGGRVRTDSTHVLAAVRELNRLELVGETMRAALEALAAAVPDWLAGHADRAWLETYGRRFETYRLPEGRPERAQLAAEVGADGYTLLQAIGTPDAPAWLREIPAVEALRRIWLQQYTRTDTATGRMEVAWREKDDLPPARGLLISPYDLDARFGIKRDTRWSGYKTHYTETCDDVADADAPHLITHVATTNATVPDVALTRAVHTGLAEKDLAPHEHVVDAGYTSAKVLLDSLQQDGVVLTGPLPADTSRQARTGTRFDLASFTIDFDAREARCPQGVTSTMWSSTRDSKSGNPVFVARFPRQACRACPVREQCTTSTRHGRQLMFAPREQHEALQAARAEQRTDAWKQRYDVRAGVEGTIHQAVSTTGVRRSRYRGQPKTHLANVCAAAAINLVRLDDWWAGNRPETTRTSRLTKLKVALAA